MKATPKGIRDLLEEVRHGPVWLKKKCAEEYYLEVIAEIQNAQSILKGLHKQFWDGMEAWGEQRNEELEPQEQVGHVSDTREWSIAAVMLCIGEAVAAYFLAHSWLANPSYAIVVSIVLTVITTFAAKLFLKQWDDPNRPRPSITRLKRVLAWAAGATVMFLVAFGVLRFGSIIGIGFPIISALVSASLAFAAGASWNIAKATGRVNRIARDYVGTKRHIALLEELRDLMEALYSEDGDQAIKLPSQRFKVNGSAEDIVSEAETPGSEEIVHPEKSLSTANSVARLVVVIMLSLLGVSSVSAQSGVPDCPFVTLNEYPDKSGSAHPEAIQHMLSSFSSAPQARVLCGLQLWSLRPWASALDAVLPSKPLITLPRFVESGSEECGGMGEADFIDAVQKKHEQCKQEAASRALEAYKTAFAAKYSEILSARMNLDLANAEADQTCVGPIMRRAAIAPKGTLNIIVSDGKHEGCGPLSKKNEVLDSNGSTTIFVLLPAKDDEDQAQDNMSARARRLQAFFPELIIVPSFLLDDKWKWLDTALQKSDRAQNRIDLTGEGLRQ